VPHSVAQDEGEWLCSLVQYHQPSVSQTHIAAYREILSTDETLTQTC